MNHKIENEDWKLGLFMEWRPKNHYEDCTYCFGNGEIGGGLGDLDGPRPCPVCHGMKVISKGPTTEKPELPPDLVEHLRRAWWDFLNKKD